MNPSHHDNTTADHGSTQEGAAPKGLPATLALLRRIDEHNASLPDSEALNGNLMHTLGLMIRHCNPARDKGAFRMSVGQRELARILRITQTGVSKRLRQLEAGGWIRKTGAHKIGVRGTQWAIRMEHPPLCASMPHTRAGDSNANIAADLGLRLPKLPEGYK